MAKRIKESTEKIRDECDKIDSQVEDKQGNSHGDPIVELQE